MADYPPTTVARFWSKVDVRFPQSCWPWRAKTNEKGYGCFDDEKAHRVAYKLLIGPIPEGAILRHHCDNPSCCNPKHLAPGTYQDNANDAVRRHRTVSRERHPNAKLTDDAVAYIRASDETGAALARRFGVSKSTISGIRTYSHWRPAQDSNL